MDMSKPRKVISKEFVDLEKMVIKIQSSFRGYLARKIALKQKA